MLASPVARVYAEALFGIARDRGEVEALGAELREFTELVHAAPDLERFLATPVLEPAVKVAHLRKALEGRASAVMTDFLSLLVAKRRAGQLRWIADAYRAMADEHAARARISVRTARPLSEELRGELERMLRGLLSKEIVIDSEVEPALLGGAVVGIGDKVYDGSIRNRLGQFRKQIMRSRGYEAQG
jgi:F-type H+-transporting ATPase subunit delta